MKLVVKKEGLLLDYLYENVDMPKKRIKQYLNHGAIFVNNNKVRKFNYKLVPGMKIVIDTESKNKKTLPFDILFEDEHIIVVNKPSGLLTVATLKEKEKTLYHIVREYLVSKNKFAKVFVIHRLDKDTSGIVIFAKDMKTKKQLQENWDQYASLREYVAVVHGHPRNDEGKIIQNLRESKTNLVYVVRNKEGKEAITNYQVVKKSKNYSLVSIKIETGRKNQIRVAFASYKIPILGDKKYGSKDSFSRLYLHANRLKIYYPYLKKEILFEVSTPIEFKKVITNDR